MFGQWNRSRKLDLGWPKDAVMSDEALKRHGYDTMARFRNWRWYKQFSGGPIADLGSHQIDIFNWITRGGPQSVQVTGGADNYPDTEWYDNMLALYDYKAPWGMVRAFYQVLNTTSYGGYYEVFMGDAASIEISENVNKGSIYPEPVVKPREWVNEAKKIEKEGQIEILLTVGSTLGAGGKTAAGKAIAASATEEKQPHLMHLENFFGAIRDPKVKLSCPGEVGFETCVSVLRANEALAKGSKVNFDHKEFEV
jgi:predicted dehydrogenase